MFRDVSVQRWRDRDVVSVLNDSVSRRFFGTSRSCLGLENIKSRSRVSGFVTLGLVNTYAMYQSCGYITKNIMDLTRKKQVVK